MSDSNPSGDESDAFHVHRSLLFSIAYELLGSVADAEDVLQESWLRWAGVDQSTVRNPRAYLVQITARMALARLRTLSRRRETYLGPWLPEPLLTGPDVAEDVEFADSLSIAMMLVLETLTPTARAVFVLREVFDLDYEEIADAVDKKPGAVRQIAHRARVKVAAGRPRGVVPPAETRAALEAFRRAIETGDLRELLDLLAPDVVAISDGGGVRRSMMRPTAGSDRVARLWEVGLGKLDVPMSATLAEINGGPALITRIHGEIDGVFAVRIENGLVTAIYYIRNPDKLKWVETETPVRSAST